MPGREGLPGALYRLSGRPGQLAREKEKKGQQAARPSVAGPGCQAWLAAWEKKPGARMKTGAALRREGRLG